MLFAALLLSGLVAMPHWAGAEAEAEQGLAERYLAALYTADLETLERLAAPDLVFSDTTSSELSGGPWRFEGREAVLGFFRSSIEHVEATGFDVIRRFTSGAETVLEVEYWSVGDATPFGAPGARLSLRVPAVTVIEIDRGQVVGHRDFVDYPSLLAQVEEQVAAARKPEMAHQSGASVDAEEASSREAASSFPKPSAAETERLEALARGYLDAIWRFDYPAMAGFLAENAVYEDYTVDYFGVEPYRFEGREQVVGFFRDVNRSSGTQEIVPEIRQLFVAGSNVIVLVDVTVTVAGKDWGVPGKRLTGSGLTITWLRILDGKIVRHTDYADYDTAIRGFERDAAR